MDSSWNLWIPYRDLTNSSIPNGKNVVSLWNSRHWINLLIPYRDLSNLCTPHEICEIWSTETTVDHNSTWWCPNWTKPGPIERSVRDLAIGGIISKCPYLKLVMLKSNENRIVGKLRLWTFHRCQNEHLRISISRHMDGSNWHLVNSSCLMISTLITKIARKTHGFIW